MVRMEKGTTVGNRSLRIPTQRLNPASLIIGLLVAAAIGCGLAPFALAAVNHRQSSDPALVFPGDPSVVDVVVEVNEVDETVTISGTVTDDGPVGGLEVVFTGGVDGIVETDGEGRFTKTFPYPMVTPADVEITAEDSDGNISEVVVKTIN